jgi:hypothetical protein
MANSRYAAKTRNGSSLFSLARIAHLRHFQTVRVIKNTANALLHTLLL